MDTGYGRAYRERLYGKWGIVDVNDCCSCAEHLVQYLGADFADDMLFEDFFFAVFKVTVIHSTDLSHTYCLQL